MSYKSRPTRLADVTADILDLLNEYQEWLDGMPENLQESATARKLDEAINTLDNAYSELDGLQGELPQGFGNDG